IVGFVLRKRIFFISILILIASLNLNAVNLSLGFTSQFAISGTTTNSSKIFPANFRDFDVGFNFSIGINQPISYSMSFSILADLGYYHDSYGLKYNIEGKRAIEEYQFDSFLIGGYGRFNFGFLSLGAGGGVKIPVSASYKIDKPSLYRSYMLTFGDLNDIFEKVFISYLRFSIDFSIFNYFLIGVYVNYDFPIHFQDNNYMSDILINKSSISSLDIGIQFGYYINLNIDKNYY
ncbi:hypothetical protein, partial [uncultured Brachyspira sp.]